MHTRSVRRSVLLLVLVALTGSGCSPTLSPLFRDYEVAGDVRPDTSLLRSALREAGWQIQPTPALPVVRTEPRTINDWLLYKVRVQLDVARVNDRQVRVFIHPRREYVFGARSKLMYLKQTLHEEFVPELNRAFARHDLRVIGDPFERGRRQYR